MVSIQWYTHNLELVRITLTRDFFLPGKNSSRVTNIGAEDLVTNDEHRDTSRSREAKIYTRLFIESFSDSGKRFVKLLFYFCRINYSLIDFGLVESVLYWLFNFFGEDRFYVFTN